MEDLDYNYKVCELTLKYSRIVPDEERIQPNDSRKMAEAFYEFYDKETIELTETAYAMILNHDTKMAGLICVGVGTSCNAMIDHKKILQAALLCNGSAVALCHNHPSYRLSPSRDDDQLTTRVGNACRAIGICLIDHIILDPDGRYYSYADYGKI